MPRGDGTGPAGMGPMTGRATGFCAGYTVPGYMNPVPGHGFWGRGRGGGWGRGGGGWGRRNWFYATGLTGWQRAGVGWPAHGGVPPYPGAYVAPAAGRDQELELLKGQADYLKDTLDGIRKRIEELEAKAQKEPQ